jgi:hypothetical protein
MIKQLLPSGLVVLDNSWGKISHMSNNGLERA